MDKRLLRNEHDKIIAGVSSGIAEYMQVDVTIIRLLFVLSTVFLFGTGILVYLVMWIVVPVNNDPAARFSKFKDYFKDTNPPASSNQDAKYTDQENRSKTFSDWHSSTFEKGSFANRKASGDFKPYSRDNDTGRTVGGLFLLVIGIYFLLNEFNIIPFWFSLRKLWPLVFVAIGLSFILKSKRENTWEHWKREEKIQEEEKNSNNGLNKEEEQNSSENNPL